MIVVIGAGPAGLAMAHALEQCGREYQVFERGRVGEAWHHHYDRLRLHTLKQGSALPGYPMPAEYPRFPSRAQFLAYLQQYAHHHALRIAEGVDLLQADFDGGRWSLKTTKGIYEATVLVMATGIWSAPVRPILSGEPIFGGHILHSCEYRNPDLFRGRRVLIVGAGNSGSEIAVDLAEHGVETAIALRRGVAFVPRPYSAVAVRLAAWLLQRLPRSLAGRLLRRRNFHRLGLPLPAGSPLDHFPVVGYELPEAVAAGLVCVYPAPTRLDQGRVYFCDGRSMLCDAIIYATGYRPALEPVAHALAFDAAGRPMLDRYGRAQGNPYLICIGYTYPTTEGWLQAIGSVVQAAIAGLPEGAKDSI